MSLWDAGSCPTWKLSDKTQPTDTRNCRTVSVSNTFLRPHRTEESLRHGKCSSGRRNLSDTEFVRHGSSLTKSGVVRLGFVGQLPCRTISVLQNNFVLFECQFLNQDPWERNRSVSFQQRDKNRNFEFGRSHWPQQYTDLNWTKNIWYLRHPFG